MKKIILQHWSGELGELEHLSIANISRYAEKVGAEYRLLRGNVFRPNLSAQCQKLYMLDEEFDDYDVVVMLDIDMFTRKGMEEDVFEDISGVGMSTKFQKRLFKSVQEKFPHLTNRKYPYWGGAVWRLERGIRTMLRPHIREDEMAQFSGEGCHHDEGVMHRLATLARLEKPHIFPDGDKWCHGSYMPGIENAALIHIRMKTSMKGPKRPKIENYHALVERGLIEPDQSAESTGGMIFTPVHPPLPTWKRMRRLREKYPGTSILRKLEYEKLQSVTVHGRCLDVGGGRQAKYLHLLPDDLEIESVNISAAMDPTHLIQSGDKIPYEDNYFDCAISLNTLEHIYDAEYVLREIRRTLKPGAVAHITVPFMFKIHAAPNDFFRATPSWWKETLARAGFSKADFQALTWGKSTNAHMIYSGKFQNLNRFIAHTKDIIYARRKFGKVGTYAGGINKGVWATATGWFMSAVK